METKHYLIDTNVVIDFLGNKIPSSGSIFLNSIVDNVPIVSVITKIELLGFNTSPEHYALLNNFINDSSVLGLSNNVVDKCIDIRKRYKTKLPDAIIAATALTFDLVLVTRNVDDFKNIPGLQVINPHEIQ